LSGGLLVKINLLKDNALRIFAVIFLNCFFDFLYFLKIVWARKIKDKLLQLSNLR